MSTRIRTKPKQNHPNYPQTPAPRSLCVRRPAGVHFVTWSGAGQSWRDRTGCQARRHTPKSSHPRQTARFSLRISAETFPSVPRATASCLADRWPGGRPSFALETPFGTHAVLPSGTSVQHGTRRKVPTVQPGFLGPPVLPGVPWKMEGLPILQTGL